MFEKIYSFKKKRFTVRFNFKGKIFSYLVCIKLNF